MESDKHIPWKDHAFSMATLYSILTAMVGVLLAVIITDKEINSHWYWPVGLLSLSFIFLIWGVEKLSDALDENDVDKYMTWLLAYNTGVILMFFGFAAYIFLHYHLGSSNLIFFLIIASLASLKWICDDWYLLFKNNRGYAVYKSELMGETKNPVKDVDRLMKCHRWIRKLFHRSDDK
jgi:hypothetical protein